MTTAERPCRVLVIDDNADIVESVAAVMRLLGHDVVTAPDGESGMEAGRTFAPHLVLMDVGLPGKDGYETARLMRAEPWGAQALLAAMTGWAREADRMQAEDAGFDAHVAKPVDLRTLRGLVTRAVAASGAQESPT
jgi:CheY-like chemotaxis protein